MQIIIFHFFLDRSTNVIMDRHYSRNSMDTYIYIYILIDKQTDVMDEIAICISFLANSCFFVNSHSWTTFFHALHLQPTNNSTPSISLSSVSRLHFCLLLPDFHLFTRNPHGTPVRSYAITLYAIRISIFNPHITRTKQTPYWPSVLVTRESQHPKPFSGWTK